nr:MAG TPA: hypothetical protein [Caudoviricetes sp.]
MHRMCLKLRGRCSYDHRRYKWERWHKLEF